MEKETTRSLADFMSSIKVEDILTKQGNAKKDISSSGDLSNLISGLQSNPPKDEISLADFLGKVEKSLENQPSYCLPCSPSSSSGQSDGDEEDVVEEGDDVEEDPEQIVESNKNGRRSNEDLKFDALLAPFADICFNLAVPCTSRCHLNKNCTNISMSLIFEERQRFFNPVGQPAPNDREKASRTLDYFDHKMRKDQKGNLTFYIGENKLCLAGFARVIGLTNSPDISKAPGQFRRLLAGCLNGVDKLQLLADQKIKLDSNDKFTEIRIGRAHALKSQKGLNIVLRCVVLPYKSWRDLGIHTS